jgi:AraC-like DNA-binding protein
MKAVAYPHWKGFELKPQGCLLEQFIDLSGQMGMAYERCVEFYKDFHAHDRLMLVFPRGASSMKIRTSDESFSINSRCFLVVPQNLKHDDEGTSAIYDTFALYPDSLLLREMCEDLEIPVKKLEELSSKCQRLVRSKWLEQLLQEYFYERVIQKTSKKHRNLLEHQIVREILKIYYKISDQVSQDLGQEDDVAIKAIRYIESNLFASISNQTIAKQIGTSESDLLRKMKATVKTTPYAYIKKRRLEEAKKLLETSNHSVGEVALLVGYNNFGAFTDAFKVKYGRPPLSWKKKTQIA